MNLNVAPPPVNPDLTTRERYAQHSADPACEGCHRLIDPVGFAFEHFDGIGRYRDQDGPHPIDDAGAILKTPNSDAEFEGIDGLSRVLAESDDVRRCYVEQWVRYGYGADESVSTECYADHLANDVAADGDTLRAVILALVRASHFRIRTGGAGELDGPGAGAGDGDPNDPGGPMEPPGAPDLGAPRDVSLDFEEQSRWPTGYCTNGTATNHGAAEVEWTIEAEIEGTINNAWNVVVSANSGRIAFSGVAWNALLGPGQSARFGYCADL
jgi:hypothetical protein